MTYEYGDDGRCQAAMTDTNLSGGADSLCMATVLLARYPDEPLNPRPNEVTYDIVFHNTRKRRNHVSMMNLKSGVTDGDENVLHPSFLDFASSNAFSLVSGNLDTLLGDRVVVGFMNGDSVRPVILGCLTSKFNTYKGSITKGERRFMQHKGTTVEIDQLGNVTIEMLNPAAKLKIGGKGLPGEESPMVLGDILKDALMELLTEGKLQSPVGPCFVDPQWVIDYLGPPGAPSALAPILSKVDFTTEP